MNRERAGPYWWMLCGAFSFAVMGELTHALGPRCDWTFIAFARAFLALVFAAVLAKAAGARLVFLRPRILWMRSLAGTVSLLCTFFAFTRLPVADVLTLTNLVPVWLALLSWPLLGAAPEAGVWLAVSSGVAGVALIQQPHLAEGNYATLLALISSLTSALAMIGLHRLQGIDARAIVVHFSGVSMVGCLGAIALTGSAADIESLADGRNLAMLLGVGVTATIGQLMLTKAFAAGPPAKVSVIGLTQIGFGLVFDLILWEHPFGLTSLAGMLLIVAPICWLVLRKSSA